MFLINNLGRGLSMHDSVILLWLHSKKGYTLNNEKQPNYKLLIHVNQENLDRVISWISIIDSKAKFVLTIILVLLGYLITGVETLIDASQSFWSQRLYYSIIVTDLLFLLAFASLLVSMAYLISIIFPKRKAYTQKSSAFYYQSISAMAVADFQNTMRSLNEDEIIDLLSDQTYNNAKVVVKKFDQLCTSIIWFWIGLGLLITYIAASSILMQLS